MSTGIWQAIAANVIWGLLPVYWKALQHVPAAQVLGYRIVWSFLSLVCVISLTRQWKAFREAALKPRVVRTYAVSAVLIGISWFTFVWAVNSGFIVETSLGYFISPLLNVAMGVLFLRERMRPWQWLPIGLVAVGVLYLTIVYGSLPWIALTLGIAFAFYGLVKKTAPLGAIFGMMLETGLLLLPALAFLAYIQATDQAIFLRAGVVSDLLILATGLMTVSPLLLFAASAQRIPLSLVGLIQYIAPTGQFLLGVLVYQEPFTRERMIGFSIVWLALIVFAVEGALSSRRQPASE
jgi:chloramphenicol-sensitive protein RarD